MSNRRSNLRPFLCTIKSVLDISVFVSPRWTNNVLYSYRIYVASFYGFIPVVVSDASLSRENNSELFIRRQTSIIIMRWISVLIFSPNLSGSVVTEGRFQRENGIHRGGALGRFLLQVNLIIWLHVLCGANQEM